MLFVARVTRKAEGNGGGGCTAAMVTNPVPGLPFLPGSSFTDTTVRTSRKGSLLGASALLHPTGSTALSTHHLGPHCCRVLTFLPHLPAFWPHYSRSSPRLSPDAFLLYSTLSAFIPPYLIACVQPPPPHTHTQQPRLRPLPNPQDRCLSAPFPVYMYTRILSKHSFPDRSPRPALPGVSGLLS